MNIRKMYLAGAAGSVLCFIGDMLLGCFEPLPKSGIFILFPAFSEEWAAASPTRFIIGSLLGVIALMMFYAGFYGFYRSIRNDAPRLSKVFIAGAFVFTSSGTLYHCVFGMTGWLYNRLYTVSADIAYDVSRQMFTVFIMVAGLAAVGFIVLSSVMFIASFKGICSKKMMVSDPLLLMMICVLLAAVLPKNAVFTGIFDWGQQSLSLFAAFVCLYTDKPKTP